MSFAILIGAAVLFAWHLEIKHRQRHNDSQELQGSDDDVS